jgi:hypothetical protein
VITRTSPSKSPAASCRSTPSPSPSCPAGPLKQFIAYGRFAKWTVAKPNKRATAKTAAEFLVRVRAQMAHPVRAVQIDGGSEFMAEFEHACADAKIPLYVLPSRSPSSTAPGSAATELGDMSPAHALTCRPSHMS